MMSDSVLSPEGLKVFNARYADKDDEGNPTETFEQAVERMAKAAASIEKDQQWVGKFADAIGNLFFVPSTPIWANIGKSHTLWQPAACFVLDVEDSLESMYETLKHTALVFKSGGGVGYNFSKIRPKGFPVRTTRGRASGVVELIRLYDASSNMVVQGGVRRGASIGILDIDHPEVLDFIRAKLDKKSLPNFNLSVGVTDRFMEALENGDDWELVFWDKVVARIPAQELWNEIVSAAHACGDPGVLFLDTLQRGNPIKTKTLKATNPCVTGDTWVMTDEGPRQVRELVNKPARVIVNGVPWKTGPGGFFLTGFRPVIKVQTKEGYSLRLTAEHRLMRVSKMTRYRIVAEWVEAKELKPGDKILIHNHRSLETWPGELTEDQGYLLGLLVGDGTLKEEAAVLSVWTSGKELSSMVSISGAYSVMNAALTCAYQLSHRYRSDFKGWHMARDGEYRLKLVGLKKLAEQMGLRPGDKSNLTRIEQASSDGYRGFLRGLFDCDGSVQGTHKKGISVRLAQSDIEVLRTVQRMLLRLGIASDIYEERRPAGYKVFPDGKGSQKSYFTKAQHELVISKDNIRVFAERVGFADVAKAHKLNSLLQSYNRKLNRERFTATVLSLTEDGVEPVFDVEVPGVNAFDANGFVAHNCGEQPLLPGESCLLGSINLARMVDEKGSLKRELYEETVRTAVRFLDNIIDVGQYPLEFIAETTRASRKIGLGFTGLADVLIKAGLAYDSEEGRKYASELTRIMRETAHAVSRELAEERGCFPLWEESVYYPDKPMRNASLITIAPTGTVTVMAGCEGYGIEPIFAVAYRKRTNVAGYLNVLSPLFIEACKKHGGPESVLDKVAEKGTCQIPGIPEDIKKIFKGAREISPLDHILMQAAVQKHVDNAVSKTINLPESAGVEDVDACFRKAYELGLKGITVFREGSKEGTVEVGEQKPKIELRRGEILPRPRSAQGSTYRLDTGCGKIYLTVNYHPDTKEILETFITTGSDGGCLIYTEATSRLVSLAIRGGISVQEIVEQLESTHSCPSYMLAKGKGKRVSPGRSCASAIARKLREIQRELGLDKKPEPASVCPDCGSVLEHAEGCMTCRGCGFSKC